MNKLQAVPRGQLQSFPMRAPLRTAQGSPGSHCRTSTHQPWSSASPDPPRARPPVTSTQRVQLQRQPEHPGLSTHHPPALPYQGHPAQPLLHRRQLPAPQLLQHLLQRLDLPQTAPCHPGALDPHHPKPPRIPVPDPIPPMKSTQSHRLHSGVQSPLQTPCAWLRLSPRRGVGGIMAGAGSGGSGCIPPPWVQPHAPSLAPTTFSHSAQHIPSPHLSQGSPSGQDGEGKPGKSYKFPCATGWPHCPRGSCFKDTPPQ